MPDVNPYAFRTAVGGFHKGDVTAYITKTAAAHQAEVEDLKKQLDALTQENSELRDQVQLLGMPKHPDQPETPEEPEAPVQAPASSYEAQELLAYRRAEAAERLACQRAKKLYGSMQSVCDTSAAAMDGAEAVTQEALDIIAQQLQRLRESLDAAHGSIRTASESLRAMGDMVPDPAEGLEENL